MDATAQNVGCRLSSFEISFHGPVVHIDSGLNQLGAPFGSLIGQIVGNIDDIVFSPERLVLPDNRLHFHQVDNTLEICLGTDGQLEQHRD